jgi:hypothetical protein
MIVLILGGLYGLQSQGAKIIFGTPDAAPGILEFSPSDELSYMPLPSDDFALRGKSICTGWRKTAGVPSFIDSKISALVRSRIGLYLLTYIGSGSTIDREYCIVDFASFLAYLPRAAQVGFLSPFPYQWLEMGVVGGGTMRKIAGGEMLLVYAGLALAVGAMVTLRRVYPIWIIALYAGSIIVVYGVATPNIGTLQRMRYGFLMLLVGLGYGWLIQMWMRRRIAGEGAVAQLRTQG